MATCGRVIFYCRQKREWYPKIPYLYSNREWTGTFFYCRDVAAAENGIDIPVFVNSPPAPKDSWEEKVVFVLSPNLRLIQRRIEFLTMVGLDGTDTVVCWLAQRIQPLRHCLRLMCEYTGNIDDLLCVSFRALTKAKMQVRLRGLIGANFV